MANSPQQLKVREEISELNKKIDSLKGGSTYAKGGSISSNWFSGELSFLNW